MRMVAGMMTEPFHIQSGTLYKTNFQAPPGRVNRIFVMSANPLDYHPYNLKIS